MVKVLPLGQSDADLDAFWLRPSNQFVADNLAGVSDVKFILRLQVWDVIDGLKDVVVVESPLEVLDNIFWYLA